MAMQISQAGLTLPRADYLSEDKSKVAVQTAYKKFQNDVWSTVQSESKVFKVSTSAYGIEKALAEMHLPAAA
jgi:predicted metalloendopeptidase